MRKFLRIALEPITWRVNFRDRFWAPSLWLRRVMALLALASGLFSIYAVGYFNVITVCASLFTPAATYAVLPLRLQVSCFSVMIWQGLGGLAIVYSMMSYGSTFFAREFSAGAWQLFCAATIILLILKYIRTPNSEMK